ncbi:MAG: hypothetical protein ATN36_07510 [Epulopiscium sp. Nele67-Bin005]|nr:MAG: hypothetical protein ATN36_07510 [Epulopiscium sp. Nele67-Bin005]
MSVISYNSLDENEIQSKLYAWSSFIEILFGVLVLIAYIVGGIGGLFCVDFQSLFTNVEYFNLVDALLIIIAIILLFVERKYLYVSKLDNKHLENIKVT